MLEEEEEKKNFKYGNKCNSMITNSDQKRSVKQRKDKEN